MTTLGTGDSQRDASGVGVDLCCLRGGVLGMVAVLLAYVGHLVGGGDPVAARELVVPIAFSAGGCLWLSRRRLSFVALLTALGGSQLSLHLWFLRGDLLATAHASTTVPSPTAMGDMHGGPGLMIAGHAVAAIITAAVLLVGENGLWNLLALLAHRLGVVVAVVVAVPSRPWPGRTAVWVAGASWTSRVLGSVQTRRGPPAAFAV